MYQISLQYKHTQLLNVAHHYWSQILCTAVTLTWNCMHAYMSIWDIATVVYFKNLRIIARLRTDIQYSVSVHERLSVYSQFGSLLDVSLHLKQSLACWIHSPLFKCGTILIMWGCVCECFSVLCSIVDRHATQAVVWINSLQINKNLSWIMNFFCCPVHPKEAWLHGDLGNLHAKSTPCPLCHVPETVPAKFLLCDNVQCIKTQESGRKGITISTLQNMLGTFSWISS